MKHFITYDKNEPQCIWGTGNSAKESLADAKDHFGDIEIEGSNNPKTKFVTTQCTDKVVQYVLDYGGDNVPWEKVGKVAQLVDAPKISFTSKEIKAIRNALTILDSKLRK